MEAKKYTSAAAFRRALDDRLKQWSRQEGGDIQKYRRHLSFDRLLARLFATDPAPWVLKGGYVMELRSAIARTTKDLDLTLLDSRGLSSADMTRALRKTLQEAAANDLGDYFTFLIGEPIMELDGAPYGGARYPIQALMDGKVFTRFHLDVGIGDVALEPLEVLEGRDWLAFAGMPGHSFQVISKEQHFAEKLHAYTLPRETPNSRVKDLVDMVLFINSGELQTDRLQIAIKATFARRGTHPVPVALREPPEFWEKPFASLAAECGLSVDIREAFSRVHAYISSLW